MITDNRFIYLPIDADEGMLNVWQEEILPRVKLTWTLITGLRKFNVSFF